MIIQKSKRGMGERAGNTGTFPTCQHSPGESELELKPTTERKQQNPMPMVTGDELVIMRRFCAAQPWLPVSPFEPTLQSLPPFSEAPLARVIYTFRLAFGTLEEFCRVTNTTPYDFRTFITGKFHPDAVRLIRYALVCKRIGKQDHYAVFIRFLGLLLVRGTKAGEANRALWELVDTWTKQDGKDALGAGGDVPGLLTAYATSIHSVLVEAILSVLAVDNDPQPMDQLKVDVVLNSLGTVDGEFIETVVKFMAARGKAAKLGEIGTPDMSGGRLFIPAVVSQVACHGATDNKPKGKRGRPRLSVEEICRRARVKDLAKEMKYNAKHPEGIENKRHGDGRLG
jgi:hypothetical protein